MIKVIIKPQAEREFGKLSKDLQRRFYKEFKKISVEPLVFPNLKKISGTQQGYRLRIGRWRILFSLFDKEKRIEVVDYS